MTDIKDLELRIKSAESTLEMLRGELEELRQQQQEPESLFGRWATHPKHGRGIITSIKPDSTGEVRFIYRNESFTDSTEWLFASVDDLTLDPATLNTAEDFEDAPVGTIVENIKIPQDVYVKSGAVWYRARGMHAIAVEYMPPCQVIRWGNGQ